MDIFAEKTILTVSRLTALLRGVLEENFEQVWVQGEVSNLSFPSSGHLYFTLKDAGAQLRCVMFKGAAKNLKFRPGDGIALIARGRISVYDQRGEYQLICEYLEPAGVGALQLAFMQLKERLAQEGLFDESRKRPLSKECSDNDPCRRNGDRQRPDCRRLDIFSASRVGCRVQLRSGLPFGRYCS